MSTAVVLLAAGRGSRMQSDLPKVLHKVAGAPLLLHAMTTLAALAPDRLIVVTGHGAEDVEAVARDQNPDVRVVHQAEQKGTGHAVAQARDALSDFSGDALVVYGDAPFVTAETLSELTQARRTSDLVVLGFEAADPTGYGRMITDDAGHL
ncbi:MAG: NTP transferase domain-containing protein, partial [Pseudomonadota bacterium]